VPFRRVWNGTESVPQQNPAAEAVTVLGTMCGFRHSEPGLVMYPYGGSATRVPLRSDTNKVVVPFFQALFLHLVEFVILKRRVSEQENAGKMMVHIRLYTPIVETQHTEDGCATPMQHQWRAPPSMSFVQVFLHSMFRRLRCTSQFAKTPHFDTYSSVVFRSHCQEIPHVSFIR